MRRIASLLLIVAGLFLLVGATGFAFYTQALGQPAPASLPDNFAGLPLTQRNTGSQAVSELVRLHGEELSLTSGAVGRYGAEAQATIWVSGVSFSFMASRTVNAMRDRIAEGRSPFTPAGKRNDGRRVIYELEGMGQKHYYFQSKNSVIWLVVENALAEPALEQTLRFYP